MTAANWDLVEKGDRLVLGFVNGESFTLKLFRISLIKSFILTLFLLGKFIKQ